MGPTKREVTKTGKAILAIMEKREMGTSALAEAMGRIPVNRLSERIYQKNISVNNLDEIVKALGYKIMLVPAGTKGNGFFEIGGEQE